VKRDLQRRRVGGVIVVVAAVVDGEVQAQPRGEEVRQQDTPHREERATVTAPIPHRRILLDRTRRGQSGPPSTRPCAGAPLGHGYPQSRGFERKEDTDFESTGNRLRGDEQALLGGGAGVVRTAEGKPLSRIPSLLRSRSGRHRAGSSYQSCGHARTLPRNRRQRCPLRLHAGGYAGVSVTIEMSYAFARGKPVLVSEEPADGALRALVSFAVHPNDIMAILAQDRS
jgi:hypothetical protein